MKLVRATLTLFLLAALGCGTGTDGKPVGPPTTPPEPPGQPTGIRDRDAGTPGLHR